MFYSKIQPKLRNLTVIPLGQSINHVRAVAQQLTACLIVQPDTYKHCTISRLNPIKPLTPNMFVVLFVICVLYYFIVQSNP